MITNRLAAILGVITLFLGTQALAAPTVRVISDRTPSHLASLFDHYEKTHGVDIEAVFVGKGLVARLRSRPTEADLVITKTAAILEEARQAGLLQPFASTVIEDRLAPRFRAPDDTYVTLSYRPRAIYVSRARVAPGEVRRYEDLTDPRWRGRVCIRSDYHNYNLSLFSQMAADRGLDATRDFISGLHENLARVPNGNDRAQVRGIYEGVCDVAIANSYYMPIMLANEEQRPWGEATRVVFPNQEAGGAYIMRGGAALTTAQRSRTEATRLLEYLAAGEGQDFIVNTTFEYPVLDTVELPAATRALGSSQPGIVEGRFKARFIPLADIAARREAVVRILDQVDFDGK